MLQPPLDQPVDLTTQSVLTFASYGIAAGLVAFAVVRAKQQRTPFPVIVLLASAIAALAEPLYDIAFKLLFFIPGQWTLFTYAGIPQPVWTVSGYMILYGGPALFICEHLSRGLSKNIFLTWSAATLVISGLFEIYGIAGGAYAYWGPHTLRILGYPLVVGVLETTFVMLFSVLAHAYRSRFGEGHALWGLLLLFPFTFYGVNFGLGAPTLVMLGLEPPSPALVKAGTLLSLGLAAALIGVVARIAASPIAPPLAIRSVRARDAHAH